MAEVFKSVGIALDTTLVTVYTVPSNTTTILLSAQAANVNGVDPADVTFQWRRGATTTRLAYTVVVPSDASLGLLSGKVVLQAGDVLEAQASSASSLELTVSYLEIS